MPTLPQFSNIRLLTGNDEALQAKIALIQSAKHSLDLVYFILDHDDSTLEVLAALRAAAERGVQVRLLVDYLMTLRSIRKLRALARIPNVSVRQYGPPPKPWMDALTAAGINASQFVEGLATVDPALLVRSLPLGRLLPSAWISKLCVVPGPTPLAPLIYALSVLASVQNLAAQPEKLSTTYLNGTRFTAHTGLFVLGTIAGGLDQFLHRTHHKLLLADKQHFIMGGRNMADAYHRNAPPDDTPFIDTDLQATDSRPESTEHVEAFEALWALGARVTPTAAGTLPPAAPAGAGHGNVGISLPPMQGYVVNGLSGPREADITNTYIQLIQKATAQGAPCAIDIVSAYAFLDDDQTTNSLLELRQSLLAAAAAGLTVKLYTNSLRSTDLDPVNHAFYQNVEELMEAGIQVFELKPELGASLHTKAAAIGDRCLVIGSYNMDPRSEQYDTNNLIVLHDASGTATQAFRQACIVPTHWTPLTPAAASRLQRLTEAPARLLEPFEQLL